MTRAFIGLDLKGGATTADLWRFMEFFDPAHDDKADIIERDAEGHVIGLKIW